MQGDVAFPRLLADVLSAVLRIVPSTVTGSPKDQSKPPFFILFVCLFLFFWSSVLFGQADWLITVIRRELDLGDLGSVRGTPGASRGRAPREDEDCFREVVSLKSQSHIRSVPWLRRKEVAGPSLPSSFVSQ